MAQDGTWGDELTLRAACEALAVLVNVITSGWLNCVCYSLTERQGLPSCCSSAFPVPRSVPSPPWHEALTPVSGLAPATYRRAKLVFALHPPHLPPQARDLHDLVSGQ